MKICAKCNAWTIEDRAIYCPFCGQPYFGDQIAEEQQGQIVVQDNRIVDVILSSQVSVQDMIQPSVNKSDANGLFPGQGQDLPSAVASPPVQNEGAFQYISRKSKSKTVLLCAFLGIFGAHHFYAGNTIWGFVYLYTLGFWGVGVIVNIVQLIRDDYCDSEGKFIMV